MSVIYHGKVLPTGNYVIWDANRNLFMAFNTITELRRAMDKYGYTGNHKVTSTGIYTEYGYFSNDELYDLYLKWRYPEVYSPTAQKIVEENFNRYNSNPEKFREILRKNPEVQKELEERTYGKIGVGTVAKAEERKSITNDEAYNLLKQMTKIESEIESEILQKSTEATQPAVKVVKVVENQTQGIDVKWIAIGIGVIAVAILVAKKL